MTKGATDTEGFELEIVPVDGQFDLACWYPGQTGPQDAYIAVDLAKRTMWAAYNAEIGNAVPAEVWHGYIRRYAIPALLPSAANALMAEWESLARRVCDGYESKWDGNNYIAHLTEDAQAADEELDYLAMSTDWEPTEMVQMSTAGDWFSEVADEVAGKTDEELEIVAEQWEAEANADDVYIVDDILEQLKNWRDGMREEVVV